MSVSLSASTALRLYRFPIERYARSYREKSTYTRITSFVRTRRVILYRSNFDTFFFLFFFSVHHRRNRLTILCDTSVCPTFDRTNRFHRNNFPPFPLFYVTVFRNHYGSIKRYRKNIIRVMIFFCNILQERCNSINLSFSSSSLEQSLKMAATNIPLSLSVTFKNPKIILNRLYPFTSLTSITIYIYLPKQLGRIGPLDGSTRSRT